MRKRKYKKYNQGIFTPKNKDKFIGTKAFYRSGLELKFMCFCDNNPNVLKWGSENVIIPYFLPTDKKMHRYYVDNFVIIKEGSQISKYLIEIKPLKQTRPPKESKRRNPQHLLYEKAMYAKNQAKWAAARSFCKKHKLKFLILTENDLKP